MLRDVLVLARTVSRVQQQHPLLIAVIVPRQSDLKHLQSTMKSLGFSTTVSCDFPISADHDSYLYRVGWACILGVDLLVRLTPKRSGRLCMVQSSRLSMGTSAPTTTAKGGCGHQSCWKSRVLRGLLPLAHTSLESKPWTTVQAVDASEWGKGVVCSIWREDEVREALRWDDRWRHKFGLDRARNALHKSLDPCVHSETIMSVYDKMICSRQQWTARYPTCWVGS